jgi:nitrite reductase (NADH) small subunit
MTPVCRLDELESEGGVAAVVDGRAVAIFLTHDGNVHAISNYDPCSQASVLARGIVGTRGGTPVVYSPMHKQAFDLRTGQCLDEPEVRVPTFHVEIVAGTVLVGAGSHLLGDAP